MGSQTFNHTGGWEQFNVPSGVELLEFVITGGGSGGRQAGRVTGKLRVKDTQTLWLAVGGAGGAAAGGTGGAGGHGGGANGGSGLTGGRGGGGASQIRLGSKTGTVKAVAGGAGGNSGDGGAGGNGGGSIGLAGGPGPGDATKVGNATGGTQIQGGNGGTSIRGALWTGGSPGDTTLAAAGAGAGVAGFYGGGGGGGGYHPGGGGQSGDTVAPAGGGGGGSNYVAGLIGTTNEQGTGGTGHGSIVITWTTPGEKNQAPSTPTDVKIEGQPETPEMPTKASGRISVSAVVNDQNSSQRVRLIVRASSSRDFSDVATYRSDYVKPGQRASLVLLNMLVNTRYYLRILAEDSTGKQSNSYNASDFWTNRSPLEPELTLPGDNSTTSALVSTVFGWTHQDPDPNDRQSMFRIRWRIAPTLSAAAGEWTLKEFRTSSSTYVLNPGDLLSSTHYEWTVKTRDEQGSWGPWAQLRSFYVEGTTRAPVLTFPARDEAIVASQGHVFTWSFRDPDPLDSQAEADLRYRVVGAADWITLPTVATTGQFWSSNIGAFVPGYRYEWQVRTTDTLSSGLSDWSASAFFWTTAAPGSGPQVPLSSIFVPGGVLGCENHVVSLYDRGGLIPRGEIGPLVTVSWSRIRDDIATFTMTASGWNIDQGELLARMRSWKHEVVIWRGGKRVAEGPITRIAYHRDKVEIEARCVLAYAYRRIMRQGYNDIYRVTNGEQVGLTTVVQRARTILMNALAPEDPNVIPYLTTFDHPDDARTSKAVPDYSNSAWGEIDLLAAKSGLDYVSAGRRIILNDTHRAIGKLPEMRDDNFSDPPVVTEYGMNLATYFAVTNNNGIWGAAERDHSDTGPVEMLASSYNEADAAPTTALTAAAADKLREVLAEQAERNIAPRWPTPVVVRVPDNTALTPDTAVDINQLIPGVWIPLRSTGTLRPVAQWQKLDRLTVTETSTAQGTQEQVQVTMSPAPNRGQDPDAEAGEVT